LIKELLDAGLLHEDVNTILGKGLRRFTQMPALTDEGQIIWQNPLAVSRDTSVLAPVSAPFMAEGGMKVLEGNLGRAIMKVSAVPSNHWVIEAPARVFYQQQDVLTAYQQGELNQDVVIVIVGQGPAANGMPELHQLSPALA